MQRGGGVTLSHRRRTPSASQLKVIARRDIAHGRSLLGTRVVLRRALGAPPRNVYPSHFGWAPTRTFFESLKSGLPCVC